jgi:hypothetical protein
MRGHVIGQPEISMDGFVPTQRVDTPTLPSCGFDAR